MSILPLNCKRRECGRTTEPTGKMILSLEEMPERFRQYEKEPWRSQGFRIVPVDNYLVVYIPEIDIQRVTVIRVLYGRRNVDEELRLHTTITTE